MPILVRPMNIIQTNKPVLIIRFRDERWSTYLDTFYIFENKEKKTSKMAKIYFVMVLLTLQEAKLYSAI